MQRINSNDRSIKEEITPIAEEEYKPRISRNKRNSGSDNQISRSSSIPKIRRVGSSHDLNIGDRFIPIRNITVRSSSVQG